MLTGDFNGDEKTDIAGWNRDARAWHVALSTGTQFDPSAGSWISNFGAPGTMLTGDFNGDGKTDLAAFTTSSTTAGWQFAFSSGHSFFVPRIPVLRLSFPGRMFVGDFNGDGKSDLAEWQEGYRGSGSLNVALSSGVFNPLQPNAGFAKPNQWLRWGQTQAPKATAILVGDFNGDKKTDVGYYTDFTADGSTIWRVALSDGSRFVEPDTPAANWIKNFGGPGGTLTGDFNGDGKTDLAGWNDAASAWHVALSTGSLFEPSAGFWITDFGTPGAMLTGDFDGQGRTSLATYAYNGTAQQAILDTPDQPNPSFPPIGSKWGPLTCSNDTFGNETPEYEWTQILDPSSEIDRNVVGAAGVAVMPELSGNDVYFTHPFGFDWEFFVAPDRDYRRLLAADNNGTDASGGDGEYRQATAQAREFGLSVPNGVLGVETDRKLVPEKYRARAGDRVAVFGRWITDCGHNDFHTEIHPPLLLAVARPGGGAVDTTGFPPPRPTFYPDSEATSTYVISRPWLVGQRFPPDNEALRKHLIHEVEKIAALASLRVEAHPYIHPPFSTTTLLHFRVRPPTRRRSPCDELRVKFHFTVRHGVSVHVYNEGSDSVGVFVTMNPAEFRIAPLPPKHDVDIPTEVLEKSSDEITTVSLVEGFLHPWADVLTNRDWLTDDYDAPQASGVHDGEVTDSAVGQLRPLTRFSTDDAQPFPIYGQMLVYWRRGPRGAVKLSCSSSP
jgi:hypothetical protein